MQSSKNLNLTHAQKTQQKHKQNQQTEKNQNFKEAINGLKWLRTVVAALFPIKFHDQTECWGLFLVRLCVPGLVLFETRQD